MNPCVFIVFSLLLLNLETSTATSEMVGEGGDDTNGVSVMKKCFDKERLALLHFKSPLQDPYGSLSSWTAEDDECCNWSGVTCNYQSGHVTRLDISQYNLGGEISHSLANLSYLTHLDLSINSFNGTIPMSIGSLTNLRYLSLTDNSLYGTIPPEFGNLTNLKVLYLDFVGSCIVENIEWLSPLSHLEELRMDEISLAKANHWVDVILSFKKLSYLSLARCDLSQVMYPYYSFLNSSSSIEVLYLQNNNLTSFMFDWLFPLATNKLQFLDLSSNMLDRIPKYFGNLCSLISLYMNYNSFVVKFPVFLNNLSGCTSLTLQLLSAERSQFTGPFSDEIQSFSSLKYLYLSHNHLNGSISEKPWDLPMLEALDVSHNNQLGPCFPKWFQTLKNLTFLDLSNTGISDTTPLEVWDLWSSQIKYLNLSSNNFSGKVPNLLSNFANGSVMDLSSNSFYGPLPNVTSTFSTLNLSRNKLSGGISFICQIIDGVVSFLNLSHNSLSGKVSDCLWHLTELKVLNLGHNKLFGRLPPSIGYLKELKVLSLYKNNFSGELPLSLKNCTNLISLNLGANNFSGNVPVWIGENLSWLYVLILRSNNFFGTIPLQSCQLGNLQILDLSMNNLHGTIPACLSNLTSMVQQGSSPDLGYDIYVTSELESSYSRETYVDHAMILWQGDEREFSSTLTLVKSIDLSSNSLTGQIPNEITNLHDLVALSLSKNALSGEIPWKFGEMKNLLTLDLSRNSFSGQIPSSMSQMTLLNYLDVSFNNLSGRIPSSTQLQSFQPSRYDGNAQLCGPPLTKRCLGDESEGPSVLGKSEGVGEDIDEVWGWFYIGGGTGFAIGFWIACGSLLLNRCGRHAFFQAYDNFKDWGYVKVAVFIANLSKARYM